MVSPILYLGRGNRQASSKGAQNGDESIQLYICPHTAARCTASHMEGHALAHAVCRVRAVHKVDKGTLQYTGPKKAALLTSPRKSTRHPRRRAQDAAQSPESNPPHLSLRHPHRGRLRTRTTHDYCSVRPHLVSCMRQTARLTACLMCETARMHTRHEPTHSEEACRTPCSIASWLLCQVTRAGLCNLGA